MPWYKTGTVSVVQNSNVVTGTNTAFFSNGRVGDAFCGPDGGWYEVINIPSETSMAISPNYQGATNAAGAYALAPMQGYVKDSADALRALVNQWGSTLAALGTTGNYDILPVSKGGTGGTDPAAARSSLGLGSVATENVVPVAKGGTGGTDQAGARTGLGLGSVATESTVPISKGGTGAITASAARTALGLGSAAVAAILGTVSQAAGVPTGAIMEAGSNANGVYYKFANGMMICTQTLGVVFTNSSNLSAAWTFPVPFTQFMYCGVNIVGTLGVSKAVTTVSAPTRSTTGITAGIYSLGAFAAGDVSGIFVDLFSIGRWY
jgi:hypothetical protein